MTMRYTHFAPDHFVGGEVESVGFYIVKDFINQTINQHYISQAEQRLNSINPQAKTRKQKIYSFSITNRELYEIELENDKGTLINNNLSIFDLYSFDLQEEFENSRYNFELLFNRYESDIIFYTQNLLTKINNNDKDIFNELYNIFILKTLNSFRNPFCIQKTINTLKPFSEYIPINKEHSRIYKKIINGHKPHLNYLYSLLNINEQQYKLWLKILFLILIEIDYDGEKTNALESLVKNIYEDKNNYKMITICYYDNQSILLSDRSFNSIDNNGQSITEFNLSASAFIIYSFINLNEFAVSQGWISEFHNDIVKKYKEVQGDTIHVVSEKNNIELLNRYNERTIYQAHSRVFSAKKYWR